eukprot:255065_1
MADSSKLNSRDLFKTQTSDDDYHPMLDPDLDAVALSQLTKEQQSNQQEQIQRAKQRYALHIDYCGGLNAIQPRSVNRLNNERGRNCVECFNHSHAVDPLPIIKNAFDQS